MTIGQLLAVAAILEGHHAPGAPTLLAAVEAEIHQRTKENS